VGRAGGERGALPGPWAASWGGAQARRRAGAQATHSAGRQSQCSPGSSRTRQWRGCTGQRRCTPRSREASRSPRPSCCQRGRCEGCSQSPGSYSSTGRCRCGRTRRGLGKRGGAGREGEGPRNAQGGSGGHWGRPQVRCTHWSKSWGSEQRLWTLPEKTGPASWCWGCVAGCGRAKILGQRTERIGGARKRCPGRREVDPPALCAHLIYALPPCQQAKLL
jgi:hypothetical protein